MKSTELRIGATALLTPILLIALQTGAQQQLILSHSQTIQLPQASIWGGISFDGTHLGVTTTTAVNGRQQLFLRKLDLEMRPVGPLTQLTFDSDPESAKRITDHKHLFLQGRYYVTFSVAGDSDLYILRTDRDGRRVGPIVPVVEGTLNRTNDMMFCTDGDLLYIGYFKPNEQSVIHTLDAELRQVRPLLITSAQLPHNNLGGIVYHEGRFYMFTGDKAGPNSNLILTIWNRDWTPAQAARRTLIPLPAGGGYFFGTGIAFDRCSRRWYIGFHHVQNVNPDATTHLDIAVFDDHFNLLEHQHGPSGHRPHFLLLDSAMYFVYDRSGQGVFLSRYQVRAPSTAPQISSTLHFPWVIQNDARSTGLAIVNSGDTAAGLTTTVYGHNGSPAGSGWTTNPHEMTLASGAQHARMLSELFGPAARTDGSWVRLTAKQTGLQAFFLSFDPQVEALDGAVAVERLLPYLVFPFLDDADVALVNPDPTREALATLHRFSDMGATLGESRTISIPPLSGRVLTSSDLWPAVGGYLSVHSTLPLAAAARSTDPVGVWECTLNALDSNGGGRALNAPQYVVDDAFRTTVTVVNLDDAATDLRLRLVDDQGSTIGQELSASLPARGRMVLDNPGLFGAAPGGIRGSLQVQSSAARLSGSIQFGDREGRRFRTALPLQSEGFREAFFGQVAEDETWFTGAALVNAGQQTAVVQVRVFHESGSAVAGGSISIPPGGRVSRLLREFAPSLPAMTRGFFTVTSSETLHGFAVFGTQRLSALAAVPAQLSARFEHSGAAARSSYLAVNPDSNFAPPRGGVFGGPGPAMGRLMVAKSPDGLHFTRTNRIVTDQGAVPDMVMDRHGVLYLYYTGWFVGDQVNKTAVAISHDHGETWTFRKLDLPRNPGESDLVDPDVLILNDGTFRLYTTAGGNNLHPRTYYSDSPDGIRFERQGVAFDPGSQALDPSTIRIGPKYHLFAGGAGDPEVNWHAVSDDGAVYRFDRFMVFRFEGFGQMMANGLQTNGGYRFYGFGNNRAGGITSFFTVDGETWTADAGYRLALDETNGLEEGLPADPAIVRLVDGNYLMVYSVRIPIRR